MDGPEKHIEARVADVRSALRDARSADLQETLRLLLRDLLKKLPAGKRR